MRLPVVFCLSVLLTSCATKESAYGSSMVGVVNHTDRYIYSASINGAGGVGMRTRSGESAKACCVQLPRTWSPGLSARVRWNMPQGVKDVIRERIVEVDRYDGPGNVYLHFFPDDSIRVVVSPVGPRSDKHPIPHPQGSWRTDVPATTPPVIEPSVR